MMDGVQVVRQKTHDVWPILLIQNNLPPDMRYKKDNLITVGIIPGPKQSYDFESFLHPLIDQFKRWKRGVRAWDGFRREWFVLRASIIQVGGDQPAVASLMGMKGPRGKFPSRMCSFEVQARQGYYYPLLSPRNLPRNVEPRAVVEYNPLNLRYLPAPLVVN